MAGISETAEARERALTVRSIAGNVQPRLGAQFLDARVIASYGARLMRLTRSIPCAVALGLIAGLPGSASPRHFAPLANAQHTTTWFHGADVQVTIVPSHPRAGEETLVGFEVVDRSTHTPERGALRVEAWREGILGHVIPILPPRVLTHDAGYPGEFTLRVTFPTSGLYRLHLASVGSGDDDDARIGLGVWPRRGRPLILVPVAAIATLAVLGWMRARRLVLA